MEQYATRYDSRHGTVPVLGRSNPVRLRSIFTRVRVVPCDFLAMFVNPDEMEAAFRQAGRPHAAFKNKPEDAIQVASREKLLNLLGAPGAGKSTFLRRLGLAALPPRPSDPAAPTTPPVPLSAYQHPLLPVLIELREFRTKGVNLIDRLTDEFHVCGFPDSKRFVESALERGQRLVLLDGLDEVPDEKLTDVITHIRGFVDEYEPFGNRFVTSCRTAQYKDAFPRFTNLVVADFDDDQISRQAPDAPGAECEQDAPARHGKRPDHERGDLLGQ